MLGVTIVVGNGVWCGAAACSASLDDVGPGAAVCSAVAEQLRANMTQSQLFPNTCPWCIRVHVSLLVLGCK